MQSSLSIPPAAAAASAAAKPAPAAPTSAVAAAPPKPPQKYIVQVHGLSGRFEKRMNGSVGVVLASAYDANKNKADAQVAAGSATASAAATATSNTPSTKSPTKSILAQRVPVQLDGCPYPISIRRSNLLVVSNTDPQDSTSSSGTANKTGTKITPPVSRKKTSTKSNNKKRKRNVKNKQHQQQGGNNKFASWACAVGRGTLRDTQGRAVVVAAPPAGASETPMAILALQDVPMMATATDNISDTTDTEPPAPRANATIAVLVQALRQEFSKHQATSTTLHGRKQVLLVTDLNVARAISLTAASEANIIATPPPPLVDCPKWDELQKQIRKCCNTYKWHLGARYEPHRLVPDDCLLQQPASLSSLPGHRRVEAVRHGAFHIYPCPCGEYMDAVEVRYAHADGSSHEIWLDYGPSEAIKYWNNAVALGDEERLSPQVLAKVDPSAFWSTVLHCGNGNVSRAWAESAPRALQEWNEVVEGLRQWLRSQTRLMDIMKISIGPLRKGQFHIVNQETQKLVSIRDAQAALVLTLENGSGIWSASTSIKVIEMLEHYRGTQIEKDILAINDALRGRIDDPQKLDRVVLQLSAGIPTDALGRCSQCGKQDNLAQCCKCHCVSYCSRTCHQADYPQHEEICTRIAGGGSEIKARTNKPRSTLPTKVCAISEVSAIGAVSIIWSGGSSNLIRFTTTDEAAAGRVAGPPQAQPLPTTAQSMSEETFQDIHDLDVLVRFLLSCGPFPDKEIVSWSLVAALKVVGGDPAQLRIRGAGFTALEWACKKGNKTIVEWLCDDPRTKALVRVGSPVGWAAYAGQVDIIRILIGKGADPSATDELLWNHTPPLLVAAGNGKLDAMKLLVKECGHSIFMKGPSGKGVLAQIESSPNWSDIGAHRKAHKWASRKLNKEQPTSEPPTSN